MANGENKMNYAKVCAPFSAEKLKELIPVAKQTTTPAELRKICLDFMRLQLTFPWVPSEKFSYTIDMNKETVAYEPEKVYGGLPYVNRGSGSIYRILNKMDPETGVIDVSEYKDNPRMLGNACSGAAGIAWARAVSSAKAGSTTDMTQANGYIPVGPYTYMKELKKFVKTGDGKYTPENVCKDNGEEVMFESYACLVPADGIVNHKHVRMISDVNVVRGEDGKIDPEESFVLYLDQTCKHHGITLPQEGGSDIQVVGGVDAKATFKKLFEESYIPFTFAEFLGTKSYDKPIMRTNNILRSSFSTEELKGIILTSNYPVSDAFITVTANVGEDEGKILYEKIYHFETHAVYEVNIEEILDLEALKEFANASNSLEIQFQLLNGTRMKGIRSFKGTLCPGKRATELEEDAFNLVEKLNAIPIANENMTPEELRKICVDFMKLQLSFPHKLSEDLNYWIERQDHKVYLQKEHVHAGIPYVNVGSSSLYRWAEKFDPKTGIVDLSELGRNKRIFGNACSGGVSSSWARCITSAKLGWTHEATLANGFIPVGPYTYPKDLKTFNNPEKITARTVCENNGEQVMYESYALVQPGDGLNNPGHIRMFTGTSTVVRNADGTIDGDKSFAIFSDQVTFSTAWHHTRQQKNGDHYVIQGGVDVKTSFKDLYSHGYLPFTFKEFLGEVKVARPFVVPSKRMTCFSVKDLEDVTLSCNYPMSDFFYTVKDPYGTVVLDGVYRSPAFSTYKVKLATVLPLKEMARLEYFDGNYRVELEIQLYNGQKLKGYQAFAGTLVRGEYATDFADKNLKAKLDAIPIAKPGMSSYRLRQICLDYMKLQCEFPHKLTEDINYVVVNQKRRPRKLDKDVVHGGLPYVTCGSGNMYRILEAYDEKTGYVDASLDFIKNARLYGNACSGGAGTAWSRVINSASFAYTPTMTQANGFLNVGPYVYDKDLKAFRPGVYTCKNVTVDNGEQVMFESYAAMLPADGVGCCGHVRMNSAYPTVVRNEDGTINGDESYTLMCEQVCYTTHPNHVREQDAGKSHYVAQGFVDVKYTFKQLFDTKYIPFTFAEFLGTKPVDEGKVEVNLDKESFTAEELKGVTLKGNFAISDVFVTVLQKGGEVYRTVYRAPDFFIKEMELIKILPWNELDTVKGQIDITCQLYNGEKLTVLTGELK